MLEHFIPVCVLVVAAVESVVVVSVSHATVPVTKPASVLMSPSPILQTHSSVVDLYEKYLAPSTLQKSLQLPMSLYCPVLSASSILVSTSRRHVPSQVVAVVIVVVVMVASVLNVVIVVVVIVTSMVDFIVVVVVVTSMVAVVVIVVVVASMVVVGVARVVMVIPVEKILVVW